MQEKSCAAAPIESAANFMAREGFFGTNSSMPFTEQTLILNDGSNESTPLYATARSRDKDHLQQERDRKLLKIKIGIALTIIIGAIAIAALIAVLTLGAGAPLLVAIGVGCAAGVMGAGLFLGVAVAVGVKTHVIKSAPCCLAPCYSPTQEQKTAKHSKRIGSVTDIVSDSYTCSLDAPGRERGSCI